MDIYINENNEIYQTLKRYKTILINVFLSIVIRNGDVEKTSIISLIDKKREYFSLCDIDCSYDDQYYEYYYYIIKYVDNIIGSLKSLHTIVESFMFSPEGEKKYPIILPFLLEAYSKNKEIFEYLLSMSDIDPNVSMPSNSNLEYAGNSLIVIALCEFDVHSVRKIFQHPLFNMKYHGSNKITPYIKIFYGNIITIKYEIKEEEEEFLIPYVEKSNSFPVNVLFNKFISNIVNPQKN